MMKLTCYAILILSITSVGQKLFKLNFRRTFFFAVCGSAIPESSTIVQAEEPVQKIETTKDGGIRVISDVKIQLYGDGGAWAGAAGPAGPVAGTVTMSDENLIISSHSRWSELHSLGKDHMP